MSNAPHPSSRPSTAPMQTHTPRERRPSVVFGAANFDDRCQTAPQATDTPQAEAGGRRTFVRIEFVDGELRSVSSRQLSVREMIDGVVHTAQCMRSASAEGLEELENRARDLNARAQLREDAMMCETPEMASARMPSHGPPAETPTANASYGRAPALPQQQVPNAELLNGSPQLYATNAVEQRPLTASTAMLTNGVPTDRAVARAAVMPTQWNHQAQVPVEQRPDTVYGNVPLPGGLMMPLGLNMGHLPPQGAPTGAYNPRPNSAMPHMPNPFLSPVGGPLGVVSMMNPELLRSTAVPPGPAPRPASSSATEPVPRHRPGSQQSAFPTLAENGTGVQLGSTGEDFLKVTRATSSEGMNCGDGVLHERDDVHLHDPQNPDRPAVVGGMTMLQPTMHETVGSIGQIQGPDPTDENPFRSAPLGAFHDGYMDTSEADALALGDISTSVDPLPHDLPTPMGYPDETFEELGLLTDAMKEDP